MFQEDAKKLVIKYTQGQFAFNKFDQIATDAELYDIAVNLNSFQEGGLDKVFTVRTKNLK